MTRTGLENDFARNIRAAVWNLQIEKFFALVVVQDG